MIQIAKSIDIPDWIIETRHDCSHGVLPSMEILQDCLDVCWDWLVKTYWKPQFEEYTDILNSKNLTDESRNSLRRLITGYLQDSFSKKLDKTSRKRKLGVIADLKTTQNSYIFDVLMQWCKHQIISRQKQEDAVFCQQYIDEVRKLYEIEGSDFMDFINDDMVLQKLQKKYAPFAPKTANLTKLVPVELRKELEYKPVKPSQDDDLDFELKVYE